MAESSVNMKFTAQTADAQKRIEELEKKVASLNNKAKETGSASKQATAGVDGFSLAALSGATAVAGLTVAVTAAVSAAKECVKVYAESERVTTRMAAVWENVGKTTGYSAEQIMDYAAAVEKTTYFEQESVLSAAQLLAATEKLSNEGFKRALDISIDLAEAMGTDVPNAASMMSRALSDPETGLRALRSAGINFTDEEKDLIKSLMDANRELEAQDIVLGKVENAYQGVAAAVKATDSGKLETIATQLENIKKNLGAAILDEIQPALDWIVNALGKIEEWSNRLSGNAKTKESGRIFAQQMDEGTADLSALSINELIEKNNAIALSGIKDWTRYSKTITDEINARERAIMDTITGFQSYAMNLEELDIFDVADIERAIEELGSEVAKLQPGSYVKESVDEYIAARREGGYISRGSSLSGTGGGGGAEEDPNLKLQKELKEYLEKNIKLSATAQVAAIDEQIALAKKFKESGLAGEEQITILDEIIAKLKEEKAAIENAGQATQDWGKDWQSLAALVGNFGSAATDMFTQMWEQEAEALEDELSRQKEAGEITVEQETEKQKQINDLRKKAFVAEKANNIANALINGALAITQCLAQLGPIAGPIAAGLVGATTALQVATISSQQFTPMAKGGIVTQATPIIAGEAGPEAIIPLSGGRGRQFLEGTGGVTINITIQGNANTEDIYEAIERAQRTGLLPSWRYVQ